MWTASICNSFLHYFWNLQGTLSKEEVENLLRHGAYDIFNEDKAGDGEAASNAFGEQDIDSILERHSRTVVHENTGSVNKAVGSTFSKATFSAAASGVNGKDEEIDIEDPDFWKKIIGEGIGDDTNDMILSDRRQRAHANYSERAYSQQLDEQILLSDDDGDESDSDGDIGEDLVKVDGRHERIQWGGNAPSDWKKDDVENLIKVLSTFGYGQIPWESFAQRVGLEKDYGIFQVCLVLTTRLCIQVLNSHLSCRLHFQIKRMAWSLVMSTLMDSAADDAEKSLIREMKAAEKYREKVVDREAPAQGGILAEASPPHMPGQRHSSLIALQQAVFGKLLAECSPWMNAVIADAINFAKENSPRGQKMLPRVLRRSTNAAASMNQSDIATMFATSVWPSLKNRGWKAEVISEGMSAGKTRYAYGGNDVSSALSY